MSVFRASRRAGSAALLSATLLLPLSLGQAIPVQAQVLFQRPTQATAATQAEGQGAAPGAPAASSGPRSLLPVNPVTDPRPAADDGVRTVGEGEGQIRIGTLAAPGEAAAGLLNQGNGGFGTAMWVQSDAGVVEALFGRLPDAWRSPVARDLARRLLLSVAIPPQGFDDAGLLGLRVRQLTRMGEADGAVALADAAAAGEMAPGSVAEPLVSALLLRGDLDRACNIVAAQVRAGRPGFWQRASILCDLQAGQRTNAELARTMLADSGTAEPAFLQLVDAAAEDLDLTLPDATGFSALDAAFFRRAGHAELQALGLPAPAVAARLATLARLRTPLRLAAAERASRYGTLPSSVVMVILGAPDAVGADTPYRSALTATMRADGRAARAESLLALWSAATEQGDLMFAATAGKPLLDSISPSADVGFLAPVALRMHLLNGQAETARNWLDLVRRRAAAGEPEAILAQTASLPLAQVAGLDPANARRLSNWREAHRDGAVDDRQWTRILMLLDALGLDAGAGFWADSLSTADLSSGGGMTADPALWRQLVNAAGGGRKGEAVLAALALIGADGPTGMDAATLATVVGALRRIGLAAEARQLAVEALIGHGG